MSDKRYPRKAEAQRKRWADPAYRERWTAGAKARWANPEYRAKMESAGFVPVTVEDHKTEKLRVGDGPTKWSRLGVPTGYTRASAAEALADAGEAGRCGHAGLRGSGPCSNGRAA
jgi:hypothetical protein